MDSTVLESPYPSGPGLTWLKGNLHTHSTRSDGRLDIQDVIRLYADGGYDFLMMSDHDMLADYDGLDSHGMVLLRGNEVSSGGPHVLHVGATRRVEPGDRQQVIDAINADGGFAVLCHPDWEDRFNHFTIEQLRSLTGYLGVEIYNGGVDWAPGDGFALNKWDMLLSAGRKLWGYATDDLHGPDEAGRGWTVVLTSEKSESAILGALRSGAFYTSTGVTIESIACEGATVTVKAPDAEGVSVFAANGRRVAHQDADEITYDASGLFSPYVRLDCYGRAHRRAWTQPFFLRGESIDRLNRLLGERPVFPIHRAEQAPRLTGELADPAWAQAEPVTRFHLAPLASAPPVATEVRGLLAEGTLFFALRCEEPMIESLKLTAGPGARSIWADDSMEIFIDVEGKGRAYWHVMVNAAGSASAAHTDGRSELPGLRARAGRYEKGWTLEVAIPVASLGGDVAPGAVWGFNIIRNRHPERGDMSWSWVGRSHHTPTAFGRIVF